jgi:DNA invertase Pin-like site-specific DNA recombinase
MRKIGYARVSTSDQDNARQIADLKQAGCSIIFQEKISGANTKRPELDKLLATIQPGDAVVVIKLDRLGRSLVHLISLLELFNQKQVDFISLGDNFDTSTPAGRMVLHISAVFAEFERAMISERIQHGVNHAKAKGTKLGRPDLKIKLKADIQDLKNRGFSNTQIANNLNISTKTVQRALKSANAL